MGSSKTEAAGSRYFEDLPWHLSLRRARDEVSGTHLHFYVAGWKPVPQRMICHVEKGKVLPSRQVIGEMAEFPQTSSAVTHRSL